MTFSVIDIDENFLELMRELHREIDDLKKEKNNSEVKI
jgi:hypothetical protein